MLLLKVIKKCALMDCDLDEDELSLGELLKKLPKHSQGYSQANDWLRKHKFKRTDIICEDCFWK